MKTAEAAYQDRLQSAADEVGARARANRGRKYGSIICQVARDFQIPKGALSRALTDRRAAQRTRRLAAKRMGFLP